MIVREERLAGYRLRSRRGRDSARRFAGHRNDDQLRGRRGGGSAVAEPPRAATAALCFNDVVAIGLIRALAEAGIAVGRDFAVIGFDDIDEAKHMLPALTSVAVNGRNLGSRAAQLLMRHLASGDFEPETCPLPDDPDRPRLAAAPRHSVRQEAIR